MDLIDNLVKEEYLKTPKIIKAFRKIIRKDFVREEDKGEAFGNYPLSIGHGQTISQPLTVAFMLELLQPESGDKILDVGSGSAWTSNLLAELVGSKGSVIGLERIEKLRLYGEENSHKYEYLEDGILKFVKGDGNIGLPQESPFDKILVSASAPSLPTKLLEQLKDGGVMVVPIGEWYGSQDIVWMQKENNNKYSEKRYPGFVFVPLVEDK